ncbi:dTDP-4-dehydrorhamnose reductase [Vreelandella titanicae]|uniref:dTDP-4-dehydrorhamnose reductase n=1 Tax=Vreelandella titanicae TaxID=664683 RepID=UPI00315A31D3|tara:strand:- start:14224 stop:15141 length:918 start_codon:yes stop_codon:yes gene_type:complete
MNIFITGGNGQVGFELQRQFALFGNILAPTRQELDLTNTQAVDTYLAEHQPALILNAAAYTAVDKAESEPEQAKRLNAELPAQLAKYAAKHSIPLVHYSTDYVYPGDGEIPWQEDSPTAPHSVYGQTKLEGDQAVTQSGCQHLIFRTSWVYAARGNNFMKTMLRLSREREALSIVNDQIGAPTPARLIAQATALAFTIHNSPLTTHNSPLSIHIPSGIYHLAPRGETSWHGFACEIFEQARKAGETLAIKPQGAAGIPTAEYPTPAQRPLNSRMNLSKLEAALGVTLPTWQSQLGLTLKEYLENI